MKQSEKRLRRLNDMGIAKRCPHCLKKLKKISENQYVCENHEPPIYYPPMAKTEDNDNE
jgi:hypothetical protein